MDTRNKRSSAIQPSLPWRGFFPAPDGAIDAGDRIHTCNLYRGLADAPPATIDILTATFSLTQPVMVFTVSQPTMTFVVSQPVMTFEVET